MIESTSRNGYALLAVLWICTGVAALTFVISAFAREAVATSRNRIAFTSAGWTARSCVTHVRSILGDAMEAEAGTWNDVDRVLQTAQLPGGCRLTARARGSRLDINTADSSALSQVFAQIGLRVPAAESAAAAVLASRTGTPFADIREVVRQPGLEMLSLEQLDRVFDVIPGPIVINHAPAPVLALLPGFTDRTIVEILDARRRGQAIASFVELFSLLSPDEPEAAAQLPGLVLLYPSAWIVTSRVAAGRPRVTAVYEVVIARVGARTTVTRRREWTE